MTFIYPYPIAVKNSAAQEVLVTGIDKDGNSRIYKLNGEADKTDEPQKINILVRPIFY